MSTSNLIALNQERHVFEDFFVNKIDLSNYENDFNSIRKYGGQILASGMVPFDKIEINKGTHQTRANDYDIGHIRILQQQIQVDGLACVPIVEWCEDVSKFCVVSGHHRIYALKDLNDEKIPVCVVEFSNEVKKEFWKQQENQHKAVKPHTTQDAVKFIVSLKESGHMNWDTSMDEETVKRQVYDTLRQAGYKLPGKVEQKIFMDAFKKFRKSTITTVSKDDAEKNAQTIFNQPKDKWKNNNYVIASGEDASRKCLMVACRTRCEYIYKNNINTYSIPKGTVSILTYFPAGYKDKKTFNRSRIAYLEKIKILNKLLFSNINLSVDRVYFEPQLKDKTGKKEVEYQRYYWDSRVQDFKKEG